MRTPTDFAREILTSSEQNILETSDSFVPFLIQKYISGVSPEHCVLVNSTLNTKIANWTDNQEVFNFLKIIIPKKKKALFKYFGKKALPTTDNKIDIDYLAENLELPVHEVKELFDIFPELCENFKEDKEKILKSSKKKSK